MPELSFEVEGSWALLLGVSTFDSDALENLPAVSSNLDDLERVLSDRDVVGFAKSQVVTNPNFSDQVATMEQIGEVCKKSSDTLFLYYAGHGLVADDGQLRLATSRTNPDYLESSSLSVRQIRSLLQNSKAKRKIFVLDCCFSGRAFEMMTTPDSVIASSLRLDATGAFGMASSASTRPSMAPAGERHTAFTGEMLSVLDNGIDSDDELLTLRDIFVQIRYQVADRQLPEPQSFAQNGADSVKFARNRRRLPSVSDRVERLERAVATLTRTLQSRAESSEGNTRERTGRPSSSWVDALSLIAFATVPPALYIYLVTFVFGSYEDLARLLSGLTLLTLNATAIFVATTAAMRERGAPGRFFEQIMGPIRPSRMFWGSAIGLLALILCFIYAG